MSNRLAVIGEHGLQFFGRVSSSLSHEIRNVLATLYENAGLLEDLVLAAEKGRPLDPTRVKDMAARLKAQVKRGKEIAENMNRFAHSADEPLASVNLDEMLTLVTSLAQRTALMHGVALRTQHAESPVFVRTDPFVLENVIWLCLDLGMQTSLFEKTLTVVPELGETGVRIHFRKFVKLPERREDEPTLRRVEALAQVVGAELTLDEENREIVLSIFQDAGGR